MVLTGVSVIISLVCAAVMLSFHWPEPEETVKWDHWYLIFVYGAYMLSCVVMLAYVAKGVVTMTGQAYRGLRKISGH